MSFSHFVLQCLEEIFVSSWWVAAFILACYLSYDYGMELRKSDFEKLHAHYIDLQKEKLRAYMLRESLTLHVNSQSDPEWVELALMKGLGLVPEGQTKVVFIEQVK